ncbi:YcjF family protein [Histidinibacterium aquaticum]|uniref:TIGR01620 family protein n=1 Tax=Histidinibacterium aquaticum TaxID=2613962 RepID=A0A5J5GIY0_9RHOB|nr:TIGR01620 family protein [Histidinibacterium aquaticum]KAA9008077.1 TIGR01620 family protein [Histidinibacterium aquaticum]
MAEKRSGPVLFDLEEEAPSPAEAAPVPDEGDLPRGAAMTQAAALAARKPSPLLRLFWSLFGAIFVLVLSTAAWAFVANLLATVPILGWIAGALIGALVLVMLALAVREMAAFNRLKRIDEIQHAAAGAVAEHDLRAARAVTDKLVALYSGRPETAWGRERLAERRGDILDADGLLGLAEADLLGPLDARALREVEAAARTVATVTAVVPLALADVAAALGSNLRMIRRIAEVYGGRSGGLSSWRLTRTVLTHLVATGAVAVGDDLIHSVAGGGLLSRVSRRFGEGIVNGALTARVGVAAIEVCRPLPFHATRRPSVTALVRRSLTGLFGTSE